VQAHSKAETFGLPNLDKQAVARRAEPTTSFGFSARRVLFHWGIEATPCSSSFFIDAMTGFSLANSASCYRKLLLFSKWVASSSSPYKSRV
jgi:hypothetical protein